MRTNKRRINWVVIAGVATALGAALVLAVVLTSSGSSDPVESTPTVPDIGAVSGLDGGPVNSHPTCVAIHDIGAANQAIADGGLGVAASLGRDMDPAELDAGLQEIADDMLLGIEDVEAGYAAFAASAPSEHRAAIQFVGDGMVELWTVMTEGVRTGAVLNSSIDSWLLSEGTFTQSRISEIADRAETIDPYTESVCGITFSET